MEPLEDTLLTRNQIPIIDLSHIGVAANSCRITMKKIASQLERSLCEKGVALLVNHGIPQHKLSAVYREMEKFRKCCSIDDETYQYSSEEIIPQTPNCMTIPPYTCFQNWYKEEYHVLDIRWLDEKIPENEGQQLRNTLASLTEDFQRVSTVMLHALAVILGDVDDDYFLNMHNETMDLKNKTSLQVLYSLRQGEDASCKSVQLPKQQDLNTFTLLAQDPDSNFEVQLSKDKWIKVGHLPGAILFHAGQHLQNWTCGKYKFLQYRIMTPEETLLQMRSGYVTMFNVKPDADAVMCPIFGHLTNIPESADQERTTQKRYIAFLTAVQHVQKRLRLTKIINMFHFSHGPRY